MARVACDLSDLLKAAKKVLVAAEIFTDAQCYISLDPDEAATLTPQSSPMAGLTFSGFEHRADTIHCESDPDETPTMDGELIAQLWIRVNLDQVGRDTVLLAHAKLGATLLIRRIIGALNNASLYNDDEEELTWRTLNFVSVRNRGRWQRDPAWRRLDVRFNATFEWLPVALGA